MMICHPTDSCLVSIELKPPTRKCLGPGSTPSLTCSGSGLGWTLVIYPESDTFCSWWDHFLKTFGEVSSWTEFGSG